jgi:hypothetical protein
MGVPLAAQPRRAQATRRTSSAREELLPVAVLHDAIMSLVVVVVIIVPRVSVSPPTASRPGSSAPGTRRRRTPGTISFVPRPDWFFYFLFYLLRIFKWPETVVLGTVGIPTSCSSFDRSVLRPLPRAAPGGGPSMIAAVLVVISMGVLTWKGASAKEALGSLIAAGKPQEWAERGLRRQPDRRRGGEALRPGRMPQLPLSRGGQRDLGAEPERRQRPAAASTSSSRTSRTPRSTGTT